MSIGYPLLMPPYPGPSAIKLTQQNMVAISQSQFTGTQQVQQWPGEWWEAEWSLPYLQEDLAVGWRAFLASLRGQAGQFWMGPRGSATCRPSGVLGTKVNQLRNTNNITILPWNVGGTGATGAALQSNVLTDPFGGFTGQAVYSPVKSSGQYFDFFQYAQPCVCANQIFTFSVWLRADVTTAWQMWIVDQAIKESTAIWVNPTTSWQRYTISIQFSTAVPYSSPLVLLRDFDLNTKALYVWGPQLERENEEPTDYSEVRAPKTSLLYGPGSDILALEDIPVPGGVYAIRAGDFIQAGNHFYMSLDSTGTDNNGHLAFNVFPRLRPDLATSQGVWWIDPIGIWRLSENVRGWGLQPGLIHDISGIKCREAY